MRAVVQRVSQASVSSNGEYLAKIKGRLLVLLGIAKTDTKDQNINNIICVNAKKVNGINDENLDNNKLALEWEWELIYFIAKASK